MERSSAARAAVERYWDGLLTLHPLLATTIGDERFDDRLPEPGEEGRSRAVQIHIGALEALARIDPKTIEGDDRLALELARYMAARDLEALELGLYRVDPVIHRGDPWSVGPGTLLPQLASLQRADTRER